MDVQIKIKILKSFDHGLQKPFSKNKEERIPPNIWFIEGLRPPFGPLSDSPFGPLYQNLWFMGSLKKRRYKNGCLKKNKNSKIF